MLSGLIDHHTHTRYCGHAVGEMQQYVDAALSRGLAGIGFSVHLPAETPIDEKVNVTFDEMEIIIERASQLRNEYEGRIRVLLGGEADYYPEQEDRIAQMIRRYPLDYVIGSVHCVGDWMVDHPAHIDRFELHGVDRAYRDYFDMALRAIGCGLFDIIGHLDVIKKFGHRPTGKWDDLAEQVALAIGSAGLCVDVNTAGADKPVGEIYPSPDLLTRCARHGAGVTIGSDAHAPDEVGRYFDEAVDLVKRCGFTSIMQFQGRRGEALPIA